MGNVYRCHHVLFTVVLSITVRRSAFFCVNHCVCNSSEFDTHSPGNPLVLFRPGVLNACCSDAQTVYKKNTRVDTTQSSPIYTSMLQRLCLYLVSRSPNRAVASQAEQRAVSSKAGFAHLSTVNNDDGGTPYIVMSCEQPIAEGRRVQPW